MLYSPGSRAAELEDRSSDKSCESLWLDEKKNFLTDREIS